MPTYKSTQGMTLEQVKKEIGRIAMPDMAAFYNKYSGKKPIKGFKSRVEGEKKTLAVIDAMLAKRTESTDAVPAKKKAVHPPISKKGAGVVVKIREMMEGWETEVVTMADLETETRSSLSTLKPILEQLHKGGWVKYASDEEIQLMELGRATTIRPDAKMTGAPGPKSEYTGKFIYILPDGPPMREGSKGRERFKLIKDGMSFAEFREAGGRNKDLAWDLKYGRVELSETKR